MQSNYLTAAKANEKIFRMILDKYKISHEGKTVEDIHKEFSEGNRMGLLTILSFQVIGENLFEFSIEDVGFLSGGGHSRKIAFENGEIKNLGITMVWMS